MGAFWILVKETVSEWSQDNASRLAAAVAYYTIFSIGPLLILVIGIVGLVFGRQLAEHYILQELGTVSVRKGQPRSRPSPRMRSEPISASLPRSWASSCSL